MTERRAILIPLLGWVLLAGILLFSALWSPASHAEVISQADGVASATATATATNTPVAIVDLAVDPEISTSYVGQIFPLTISVSAGSQEVDAIDARLFFSPTEMLIIGVDNGPTLNNVLNKTVNNMSGYRALLGRPGILRSTPHRRFHVVPALVSVGGSFHQR